VKLVFGETIVTDVFRLVNVVPTICACAFGSVSGGQVMKMSVIVSMVMMHAVRFKRTPLLKLQCLMVLRRRR